MEAAPLSPAHIIKSCFFKDTLKGVNIANTAIGLDTNVINNAANIAVGATLDILEGKERSPNKKNNTICMIYSFCYSTDLVRNRDLIRISECPGIRIAFIHSRKNLTCQIKPACASFLPLLGLRQNRKNSSSEKQNVEQMR